MCRITEREPSHAGFFNLWKLESCEDAGVVLNDFRKLGLRIPANRLRGDWREQPEPHCDCCGHGKPCRNTDDAPRSRAPSATCPREISRLPVVEVLRSMRLLRHNAGRRCCCRYGRMGIRRTYWMPWRQSVLLVLSRNVQLVLVLLNERCDVEAKQVSKCMEDAGNFRPKRKSSVFTILQSPDQRRCCSKPLGEFLRREARRNAHLLQHIVDVQSRSRRRLDVWWISLHRTTVFGEAHDDTHYKTKSRTPLSSLGPKPANPSSGYASIETDLPQIATLSSGSSSVASGSKKLGRAT